MGDPTAPDLTGCSSGYGGLVDLEVKREVDEEDRRAINALLATAASADGHRALSDHAWLDLVDGGRPGFAALVAYERGHAHPVAYAQLSRADSANNWSIDLVIHPHHRYDSEEIGRTLLQRAVDVLAAEGGGHVHFWVSHPSAAHDRLAAAVGLQKGRDLLQMRVTLPLDQRTDVSTRAFVVDHDEGAWIDVNNRAFDWHPEQGGWTLATLARREKEPWFDPAGFLLHEREGRLAAFCWTKLHPAGTHDPAMGEIYVIAVNPDFQGLGLGRALTVAGLASIAERGVATGMLYVDATNDGAVALYTKLGFTVDHINRAYAADIAPALAIAPA